MTAPLDRLRPVVRTSADLAPITQPDTVVRRPAGMLLVEALRLNDAYTPRLVTREDLADWGAEADAAYAAARSNLTDERRAFLMEALEHGNVVRNLQPEGNATTWALHPDFVRAMMPPHPTRPGADDPLVFIPEPETMFIARSSNAQEVAAALASARDVFAASAHPIAPCAFRFGDGGRLEPWLAGPDAGERLAAETAAARAEFVCHVYGQVCDAYAATPESRRLVKQNRWQLNRPELADGARPEVVLRQATWQPAKQVLVPVYAQIRFVPNKADAVTVNLARLAAATPGLLSGFVLDPSWAILAGFPTAEQLAALAA